MDYLLDLTKLRGGLRAEVEELSGENIADCYQCGNCTAGCPTTYKMEHGPNVVLRLLQIGAGDELLRLNTPWLCASCETCATRCPKGVSVAAVMDALRQIARLRKIKPPKTDYVTFTKRFLGTVKQHSRLFELQLGMGYNLTSGHFFSDMTKMPGLVFKGKLKLLPGRGTKKGREAIKGIFERVEKLDQEQSKGGK